MQRPVQVDLRGCNGSVREQLIASLIHGLTSYRRKLWRDYGRLYDLKHLDGIYQSAPACHTASFFVGAIVVLLVELPNLVSLVPKRIFIFNNEAGYLSTSNSLHELPS
jgi:hypothetical protein